MRLSLAALILLIAACAPTRADAPLAPQDDVATVGAATAAPERNEMTEAASAPSAGSGGGVERPPGDAADRETVLAMQAAFPGANSLTGISVGGAVDAESLPNAWTHPLFLSEGDGRYVLVTATEPFNGCHAEDVSHDLDYACPAELSVFYLSRRGDLFLPSRRGAQPIKTSGAWGHANEVVPVVFSQGRMGYGEVFGYTGEISGYSGDGCTTSIAIVLFGPAGPVEVLTEWFSVNATEFGMDLKIDGALVSPPPAGADFALRFSGHSGSVLVDETVTWRFNGDRLVPLSGRNPVRAQIGAINDACHD